MTGHNIAELDTTKFTTVFLDISNEKAAQRLYGRNSMAYESVLSAYNEVLDRNNRDGMEQTKILMKDVYNMIYVDTTELSEEQVTSIVIDEIEKIESKKQKFEELQATSSIERQNFKWMFNPFLEVIKAYLERNIDRYLVNKEYISRTDLEYQVLIKMCSYNIEKVFKGDSSLLREMDNGIKSREDNLNEFVDCLIEKKVNLNYELVNNEIKNQIERLDALYNDDFIKKVMSKLNSSENKKNMSLKNITYKKVDKEVSKFIAKNCHYLHTPREDELFAYGAFGEESVLPIAWVSFSKQDREYKKQLLHYLEVEPQNTLEMTRAWCSNSAPSNIMSSLFQHSINEAKNEWKKLKQEGKVNKNLQAITTTINPNLGFKASSFLGCNFTPFALRPVKFTYGKQGGAVEYMTRREIEKNKLEYIENKFNVLPMNEIILCLDDKKQQEIAKGKIYAMDKKIYNRVLGEVMDEKNIDSYQEQR